MSLAQVMAVLRAARWRIALMVVVAALVAFGVASTLPKQYTAKARVLLDTANGDQDQVELFGPAMAPGYVGTELGLVKNEAVARDVVEKLGWPDNPQVITEWETATGGQGNVTEWAATAIGRNIAAAPVGESAIIEIYYSTSSLDAAKQIVALVRTAFIAEDQKLRADAAARASAWNRTQATRALAELRAAEAARAAFVNVNQIAVDAPGGGLDFAAQMATMRMLGQSNKAVRAAVSPTVSGLRNRLDALDAQLAIARLGGERSVAVVTLQGQRDIVAQQLARETAVTLAGANATDTQIGLVRAQLDADYLKARLTLLARSPLYDRLAAMDRDIAFKTKHYVAAAAHVAAFAKVAAAPSGLNVLGDVIADDEPSYPNIPAITGLAAASSLALAVALAILGELKQRRVRTTEDLTVVGAPVLAVIAPAARRRRRAAFPPWPRRARGPLRT